MCTGFLDVCAILCWIHNSTVAQNSPKYLKRLTTTHEAYLTEGTQEPVANQPG